MKESSSPSQLTAASAIVVVSHPTKSSGEPIASNAGGGSIAQATPAMSSSAVLKAPIEGITSRIQSPLNDNQVKQLKSDFVIRISLISHS